MCELTSEKSLDVLCSVIAKKWRYANEIGRIVSDFKKNCFTEGLPKLARGFYG